VRLPLWDDETAHARRRFVGEPVFHDRGVFVWNPFHHHCDRPAELHHLWLTVPKSWRERPANLARMREVLRGGTLHQDDSGRDLDLRIKHDVAVSVLSGGALVAASCEVAPLYVPAVN
jgi:hypothetical protein